MRELTFEEVQRTAVGILFAVADFCERHGLRYYLHAGTLLGAVRHEGMIPWDDDVDIIMPRRDYEAFERLARTSLPEPYAFINWKDNWMMQHNFAKVYDRRTVLIEHAYREDFEVPLGVYIDIYPMDGAPRGRLQRWLHGHHILLLRIVLALGSLRTYPWNRWPTRWAKAFFRWWLNEGRAKRLHGSIDRLAARYSFDDAVEWADYLGFRGVQDYFPRAVVGRDRKELFEGRPFPVFASAEHYLRVTYGEYMTLPPKDERTSHHDYTARWRKTTSVEGS